jgi:hypothetical protein
MMPEMPPKAPYVQIQQSTHPHTRFKNAQIASILICASWPVWWWLRPISSRSTGRFCGNV